MIDLDLELVEELCVDGFNHLAYGIEELAYRWSQLLAHQLNKGGVACQLADNAFVQIADYARANQLADEFDIELLHQRLDEYARQYCLIATDLIFKGLETVTHAVKPADIATFLGRKLNGNYQGETGNRFNRRWLGMRLKHQMGPSAIKL